MKFIRTNCAFFILLIISSLFSQNPEELVINSSDLQLAAEIGTFQKLKYGDISLFRLADMDNDGDKDLIFASAGKFNYISVRTKEYLSICEIPLSSPLNGLFFCEDINRDTVPEIIYLTVDGTDVFLNIYFPLSEDRKKINIYHGENYFKDNIYDVNLIDTKRMKHSSGQDILLLELNTGHDRSPRGMLALSLPDLKPVWQFFIGATAFGPMCLADLNGDGSDEILFSTCAADNGVSLKGYSDDTSYFIVLDENGQEWYHTPYGGPLSYCYFNLISPQNDIILYGYSNSEKSLQPDILKIDVNSLEITKTYSSDYKRHHFPENNVIRPAKDFRLRFLGAHNKLHLLDNKLTEKQQIIFPAPLSRIMMLSRETSPERYYLASQQNIEDENSTFYLITNNFEIIGKKTLPLSRVDGIQFDNTEEGIEIYLFNGVAGEIYEWYVPDQQLQPIFRINYFIKAHSLLITYTAIGMLFLASMLLFVNLLNKKNLNIQKYKVLSDYLINNPFEAILIVDKNGNLSAYNHTFSRWFSSIVVDNYLSLPIEKLLEKLKVNWLISDMKKAIVKDITPFHKNNEVEIVIANRVHRMALDIQKISITANHFYLIIKFFDLTDSLHKDRISGWAAIAQKMAHEIKNPLMSMTLSLGRLEKNMPEPKKEPLAKELKYLDYIREDIQRMKDSTNEFLRFTSSLKMNPEYTGLNQLLQKLINEYRQLYSDRIDFELQLANDLPDIFIDAEQTIQIIRYIIDNGVDAIAGKGRLQVKTNLLEKLSNDLDSVEKYVLLMITDDGTGIAQEHLVKIFEPNFTTKKTGSGFGLAIARQVVELQGGHINISSKPEVGTMVEIEFPVENNK